MPELKGEEPGPGEEALVEELLRVNAELAAELRSVTLGRAEAPRPTLATATRRIATAIKERDRVIAERDQTIDELKAEMAELLRRHDELRDLVERQVLELERLRAGPVGVLRRAQARILRGRANRGDGA
jgi:hypothetical protein